MVKRRRTVRKTQRRAPARRNYKRPKNKTLKERFLTTAIWGLSLINVTLIISLVSNYFASPNETALTTEPKREPNKIITVEVLNACGVQGLANEITQYLRQKKFDVVNVGNYPGGFNLEQTIILDRASLESHYAKKVARELGVNQSQTSPQIDDSLQLMVSVIIGKDYKKLKVYEEIQK